MPRRIAEMEAAGDPKAGLAADMLAEYRSHKRKHRNAVRRLMRLLRKYEYHKTAN
jgi:hypothetical protein